MTLVCQSGHGLANERIMFACPRQIEMLSVVRRLWLFIKYWLPPLLWMTMIFIASTGAGSFHHSSRILEPVLRWLFPAITDPAVHNLVFAARKMAHVTEYACCAILLWRALRQHTPRNTRPWNWRDAKWSLAIIFAYACTDEIHQHFVPGRQGAFLDVLLDTLGGALGLFALWRAGKWLKRW